MVHYLGIFSVNMSILNFRFVLLFTIKSAFLRTTYPVIHANSTSNFILKKNSKENYNYAQIIFYVYARSLEMRNVY